MHISKLPRIVSQQICGGDGLLLFQQSAICLAPASKPISVLSEIDLVSSLLASMPILFKNFDIDTKSIEKLIRACPDLLQCGLPRGHLVFSCGVCDLGRVVIYFFIYPESQSPAASSLAAASPLVRRLHINGSVKGYKARQSRTLVASPRSLTVATLIPEPRTHTRSRLPQWHASPTRT